jgi:hypothetical protein
MWEVGWTESRREGKVELNTREKMRKVFTKEIVASQAFVNVKFNEALKLLIYLLHGAESFLRS